MAKKASVLRRRKSKMKFDAQSLSASQTNVSNNPPTTGDSDDVPYDMEENKSGKRPLFFKVCPCLRETKSLFVALKHRYYHYDDN